MKLTAAHPGLIIGANGLFQFCAVTGWRGVLHRPSLAILAAIVGSMGLMSTMSINVVERGREIGVMRATGATSLSIAGIFVGEGLLLGFLSWLFSVPISYPGAQAFSSVIGRELIEMALDFKYPIGAVALWLAIILALSALASLWPALRATRVSVRESLAYE